MKRTAPIRKQTAQPPAFGTRAAVRVSGWGTLICAALLTSAAGAQTYQRYEPRPQPPHAQPAPQMPMEPHPPMQPGTRTPPQPQMQRGRQRLGQWLSSHQNETPEQQQRSLAREPGFNTLSPDQQQRMQQRLTQLNAMPPAQRQRTLAHMEAMERLTPDQRQQVRGALAGLGGIPPDRRHAVARGFHQLRMLPPNQQQQMLNSPQFRSQFTEQERGTLSSLMSVEPYLPPPTAPATTQGH